MNVKLQIDEYILGGHVFDLSPKGPSINFIIQKGKKYLVELIKSVIGLILKVYLIF